MHTLSGWRPWHITCSPSSCNRAPLASSNLAHNSGQCCGHRHMAAGSSTQLHSDPTPSVSVITPVPWKREQSLVPRLGFRVQQLSAAAAFSCPRDGALTTPCSCLSQNSTHLTWEQVRRKMEPFWTRLPSSGSSMAPMQPPRWQRIMICDSV